MNLKRLVSLYIEHYDQVIGELDASYKTKIDEIQKIIQVKTTAIKNYNDIIHSISILSESEYMSYMQNKYGFDHTDIAIIEKMEFCELCGNLSKEYKELDKYMKKSSSLKKRTVFNK